MNRRTCGILLHITSLPSPYGVGDLGDEAYRFADFLAEARQSVWQILPLNPTDVYFGSDPYHSTSAFAGNPLLISTDLLLRDGLLEAKDLPPLPSVDPSSASYEATTHWKTPLLQRAFNAFRSNQHHDPDFQRFCQKHHFWLHDYALFAALKNHFEGKPWCAWPLPFRDRHTDALQAKEEELADELLQIKFLQYLFFTHWQELRDYCQQKDIQLFGDMPIYVDHDSADIWVRRELFKLDNEGMPTVVAGVPPDYFSATGQLWGSPVYNWEAHQRSDFDWWIQRVRHNLTLFDFLRIDHFRGLVAYWEVAAGSETAIEGEWIKAPVMEFFHKLTKKIPLLPIIAEDLGIITPDVREVMQHFNFPGMKILQFAFGADTPTNPYIPHNLERNCIAYTGTHDNMPLLGWFEEEASDLDRDQVMHYLGRDVPPHELHWDLIRLVMASVADWAIFPVQDLLGLGANARMNRPGHRGNNWLWRVLPEQLSPELAHKLADLAQLYNRD